MKKNLYFLPGTMCDHRLWLAMINELEYLRPNEFQCHFLTISEQISIDAIIDAIKKQLPNEKVILVGFSLGGYLASAFTVKYPSQIKKLMVISNMPCALPEQEIKERSRTVAWIKQNGYRGIPLKRILALLDVTAQTNNDIISLIKEMDDALGEKTLLHQLLTTTKRQNLFMQLSQLPISKYFCVGRNDKLVPVSALDEFSVMDERMKIDVFDNAGHMLPLEKPKELANWLNSALIG
jgi:2-succinyl-6-hydroxy-2,4-cyclohexadiene-1-carboxylate synthase